MACVTPLSMEATTPPLSVEEDLAAATSTTLSRIRSFIARDGRAIRGFCWLLNTRDEKDELQFDRSGGGFLWALHPAQ